MKWTSPCVRSRRSPKVCKGQHDRWLMKRRSPQVNMIACRCNGDLHACVVGGRWSYAKVNKIAGRGSDASICAMCMGKSSLGEVNVGGLGYGWFGKVECCFEVTCWLFFGYGLLTLRLFSSNHKGEFLLWMIGSSLLVIVKGWDTPEVSL